MSVITFPDEAAGLNPKTLELEFWAEVDGRMTLCAMTSEALRCLGAPANLNGGELVATFERHKERIHGVARNVLPARTRLLEDDFSGRPLTALGTEST